MATDLEYLQSIATAAVEAQQALESGSSKEVWNLLSGIRADLDAVVLIVSRKDGLERRSRLIAEGMDHNERRHGRVR